MVDFEKNSGLNPVSFYFGGRLGGPFGKFGRKSSDRSAKASNFFRPLNVGAGAVVRVVRCPLTVPDVPSGHSFMPYHSCPQGSVLV